MPNQTFTSFPTVIKFLNCCSLRSKLCVALTALISTPVMANLNDLPGMNGVQTATAAAVQTICPQMAALNSEGDGLSGNELSLFERCRELVQTSNEQQGSGGTDFSLGLSESELRDALQRIAPEETEVMGAGVTDTSQDQIGNVSSRMQTLRSGMVPVTSLAWGMNGHLGGAAGDGEFSRLGAFINGIYGSGDRDSSDEQNGFEYDAYGLTLGMDYRINDGVVAGVALGISNSEADLDGGFGDFDTDGLSLTIYGTYYAEQFYLEGSLGFGAYDYEGKRNIEYSGITPETVSMDTEGDHFTFSLAAGYSFNQEKISSQIYARIEGVQVDLDGYEESGSALAMQLDDQEIESLQLVAGAQISYTSSHEYGVFVPYIGLAMHHETDDEERDITAQYIFDPTSTSFSFSTEAADSNFAVMSLGSSMVLKHGNQLFFNFDRVLGLDNVTARTFTAGARFEF